MSKIAIKIQYLFLLVFFTLMGISCSDYLDVELQNQMTLQEVFDKRSTTEAYLAQVYGYLPVEEDPIYAGGGDGTVVSRSDEALFSWLYGEWESNRQGAWGVTTEYTHNWERNYNGINQATIFMNNVDRNTEINESTKEVMKAEARFIRAYLYFSLFRKYGPVYIWGDQESTSLIRPDSVDRHSVDRNVQFIISEYDKAIEVLPLKITDEAWFGRITKGAVMAAKSRLTLYAARPQFNGAALYKGMKNIYGEYLFPQAEDPDKWEIAAQAAKDVIDLGIYSLYKDTKESDPFKRAIKSYQGVWFDKWNEETIWGKWVNDAFSYNVRCAPPRVVKEGYGGYAPSLKLVDSYPMAKSGRYPITGYRNNGEPIVDPQSGYRATGFTEGYIHPLDNFAPIKAHNSCIGRDARYYASILANGMNWINTYKGVKLVTFYTGGTSSYSASGDCVKSGFLWRRFSDPTNNIEEGQWGQYVWPYYRLAEIYLNYAEACNEKPNRNESEALKYINLVRERSGLNKIEEAYPEVIGNKTLLRNLIRKERMVELAFEGHRFYDVRTWMVAEEESNKPNYTLNLLATNYEDSWERTDRVFPGKLVCEPKHLLFPLHQSQLSEMRNITQNYGW
ncbi:MAG: RagB/SusD family nutrient uptake outer membrane protein [Petrimonas sp.]|uniref:RagB/SusD family nutrient uptake outer membrane protein n=1 Tax=Petrimonas sp. TaxID=2023866 RepID=UPI002B374155|nr:RagB/SusD family nutrient uptake outer membrane protein [Petrimonas sp.]MEA4979882.1 RagB/SusD family nutrient uptake outer membrane protein [Petrimonas sp.]MEA5046043.1 RagB/SusD family nutrient uptake outer membrane protein [Petrimonas sp.]